MKTHVDRCSFINEGELQEIFLIIIQNNPWLYFLPANIRNGLLFFYEAEVRQNLPWNFVFEVWVGLCLIVIKKGERKYYPDQKVLFTTKHDLLHAVCISYNMWLIRNGCKQSENNGAIEMKDL